VPGFGPPQIQTPQLTQTLRVEMRPPSVARWQSIQWQVQATSGGWVISSWIAPRGAAQ
jgi:hypothetical protein